MFRWLSGPKLMTALDSLYDVIHRRRDTRREFTGEPVRPEVLERVLLAAHAAPSAHDSTSPAAESSRRQPTSPRPAER